MATSYTQATGKRPYGERERGFLWFMPLVSIEDADELPIQICDRLQGGIRDARDWVYYPSEAAALAAADAAYLRAVAEGAMGPIEGVAT